MRIVDYFIDVQTRRTDQDYSRKRLLVIVLLFLVTVSGFMSLMSLIGMFSGTSNLLIFLFLAATLAFMKVRGDFSSAFLFTTIICTSLMVYNSATNGYVLSFNNKWFIIALISIFFIKPKWLTPYFVVLVAIQTCFLIASYHSDIQASTIVLVEEFLDNVIFFTLCYALLVVLDSYQRKQNEEILHSNSLLEERTRQLTDSNSELEKYAFLVSHDLKTPLRNIISFSMLLKKKLTQISDPQAYEYASYMHNSSMKLDRLVDDVLSYSRVATKNQNLEEVDLNLVISDIEDSISAYLDDRNGRIQIAKKLPIISSQRSIMIQLLKNLIENGLKYNEAQTPTVILSYAVDGTGPYVSVSDNGIGIKEQYHDSIFNMFSRLHSDHEYEGSGIGLSTCKRILEKMGGRISINSNSSGSTFKLYFPRQYILPNRN